MELIGGFVAIVPATPSPGLDELAADCVTGFERFRLPMTAQERSRRLAAGLSQHQTANLERWGYPYVFEEFRFHMTLTDASGRIGARRSMPSCETNLLGLADTDPFGSIGSLWCARIIAMPRSASSAKRNWV